MKVSIFLVLLLKSVTLFAQITFIDRSGVGLFVRDQQNAALFITGEVANMISEHIPHASRNAQVSCENNFCTIAQLNRKGLLTSVQGKFAVSNFFPKLFERMKSPRSLSEEGYFEEFTSKIYAYPNQCQDSNSSRRQTLKINLEGIVAEQLYNYISNKEERSLRYGAQKKTDINNFFSCEKITEYDPADINETTGALIKNAPHSYVGYSCEFEVEQTGLLVRNRDCHIYGGAISAGGK